MKKWKLRGLETRKGEDSAFWLLGSMVGWEGQRQPFLAMYPLGLS